MSRAVLHDKILEAGGSLFASRELNNKNPPRNVISSRVVAVGCAKGILSKQDYQYPNHPFYACRFGTITKPSFMPKRKGRLLQIRERCWFVGLGWSSTLHKMRPCRMLAYGSIESLALPSSRRKGRAPYSGKEVLTFILILTIKLYRVLPDYLVACIPRVASQSITGLMILLPG